MQCVQHFLREEYLINQVHNAVCRFVIRTDHSDVTMCSIS